MFSKFEKVTKMYLCNPKDFNAFPFGHFLRHEGEFQKDKWVLYRKRTTKIIRTLIIQVLKLS